MNDARDSPADANIPSSSQKNSWSFAFKYHLVHTEDVYHVCTQSTAYVVPGSAQFPKAKFSSGVYPVCDTPQSPVEGMTYGLKYMS